MCPEAKEAGAQFWKIYDCSLRTKAIPDFGSKELWCFNIHRHSSFGTNEKIRTRIRQWQGRVVRSSNEPINERRKEVHTDLQSLVRARREYRPLIQLWATFNKTMHDRISGRHAHFSEVNDSKPVFFMHASSYWPCHPDLLPAMTIRVYSFEKRIWCSDGFKKRRYMGWWVNAGRSMLF
jgi:hypothetical protein